MADGEQPLLEKEYFEPLKALVAKYGIKNLVETGTGPSSSGMEAAKRLGLMGYTCDVYEPCVARAAAMYPAYKAFLADSVDMLRAVLPRLEGPTFFWLDGHCPTSQNVVPTAFAHIFPVYEEMELIRDLKRGYEKDVIWLDDVPMIDVPDNPSAVPWDVDLAGVRWTGQKDRPFADYLAIFEATHTWEIVGPTLRLTPR